MLKKNIFFVIWILILVKLIDSLEIKDGSNFSHIPICGVISALKYNKSTAKVPVTIFLSPTVLTAGNSVTVFGVSKATRKSRKLQYAILQVTKFPRFTPQGKWIFSLENKHTKFLKCNHKNDTILQSSFGESKRHFWKWLSPKNIKGLFYLNFVVIDENKKTWIVRRIIQIRKARRIFPRQAKGEKIPSKLTQHGEIESTDILKETEDEEGNSGRVFIEAPDKFDNAVNICPFTSTVLHCPPGYSIIIHLPTTLRITYQAVCPKENAKLPERGSHDFTCLQYKEADKILQHCNGQQNCIANATNIGFGDKCQYGKKYIPLQYECKGLTTVILCQDSQKKIKCIGENEVIIIHSAFWGRKEKNYCELPASNVDVQPYQSDQCSAPNAFKIIEKLCMGKKTCVLEAKSDKFENPCPFTEKYLKISYNCNNKDAIPKPIDKDDEDSNVKHSDDEDPNGFNDLNIKDKVIYTNATIEEATAHLCPFTNNSIHCAHGYLIRIINYELNFATRRICVGMKQRHNEETPTCIYDSFIKQHLQMCNGKTDCNFDVTNSAFGENCHYVTKYLAVDYNCESSSKIVICQNSKATLTCKQDQTIKISSATFGRSSEILCSPSSQQINPKFFKNTNCYKNVYSQVYDVCNGKETCSLEATVATLTDPCPNIYKYLEIEYNCEDKTGSLVQNEVDIDSIEPEIEVTGIGNSETTDSILICPYSTYNISCLENHSVKIKVMKFSQGILCDADASFSKSLNCPALEDLTESVVHECSGLQKCQIDMSTKCFGPAQNTYLNVEYSCEGPAKVIICQGARTNITCKLDEKIHITYANFGRTSNSWCLSKDASIPSKYFNRNDCHTLDTLDKIKETCENKPSCYLGATTSFFGDPCSDTFKYLEVEYICKEPTRPIVKVYPQELKDLELENNDLPILLNDKFDEILQVLICQHQHKIIACPDEEVLNIIQATYGRLSSTICLPKDKTLNKLTSNTACNSLNALDVTKTLCDKKQFCLLHSSSTNYEDPCPEILKYLHVEYRCKKRPNDEESILQPMPFIHQTTGVGGGQTGAYINICPYKLNHFSCPESATMVIGQIDLVPALPGVCQEQQREINLHKHKPCKDISEVRAITNKCFKKRSCSIDLIEYGLGPNCGIPVKNLVVGYSCEGATRFKTCQYDSMDIQCYNKQVIKIVSAFFGRDDSTFCRPKDSSVDDRFFRNTKCKAENTLSISSELCNGKTDCNITVSTDIFGEPCDGTLKYLQIGFLCVVLEIAPTTFLSEELENVNRPIKYYDSSRVLKVCPGSVNGLNCHGKINDIEVMFSTLPTRAFQDMCLKHSSPAENHQVDKLVQQSSQPSMQFSDLSQEHLQPIQQASDHAQELLQPIQQASSVTQEHFQPIQQSNGNDYERFQPIQQASDVTQEHFQPIQQSSGNDNERFQPIQQASDVTQEHFQPIRQSNGNDNERFQPIQHASSVTQEHFQPIQQSSGLSQEQYQPYQQSSSVQDSSSWHQQSSLLQQSGNFESQQSGDLHGQHTSDRFQQVSELTDGCLMQGKAIDLIQECEGKHFCTINTTKACWKRNNYIDIKYSCSEPKEEIICQNHQKTINCYHQYVTIIQAMFGRTDTQWCRPKNAALYNFIENVNCKAENIMQKVTESCHGHHSCSLTASAEAFGDPCPDVYKYLDIQYYCSNNPVSEDNLSSHMKNIKIIEGVHFKFPTSGNINVFICQNSETTISCHRQKVLKITHAVFGRTKSNVCIPNDKRYFKHIENIHCSKSVLEKIQEICNNEVKCLVSASAHHYQDDCPQTFKYLEIHYECVDSPEHKSFVDLLLSNQFYMFAGALIRASTNMCPLTSHIISCPDKHLIQTVSPSFIFGAQLVCQSEDDGYDSVASNTKIKSPSFTCISFSEIEQIIKNLCLGKDECTLDFSLNIFENLCTKKSDHYLTVDYVCEGTSKAIICQNSIANISCTEDKIIHIVSAEFGRQSSSVCRENKVKASEKLFQDVNCKSDYVKVVVESLCNGKTRCELVASPTNYGDPCPQTFKYLEVHYLCVDKPREEKQVEVIEAPSIPVQNSVVHGKKTVLYEVNSVCPHSSKKLSCPLYNTMEIDSVKIFSGGQSICGKMDTTKAKYKTCMNEVEAKEYFSNQCHEQNRCIINTTSIGFGQNCKTQSSYLQVTSVCEGATSLSICENSFGEIICPNYKIIRIDDVNFGRTKTDICRLRKDIQFDSYYQNIRCHSPNSKIVVQNMCNGKQSCKLQASTRLFGNPCADTDKYLEVVYFCIDESLKDNLKYEKEFQEIGANLENGVSFRKKPPPFDLLDTICPQSIKNLTCPKDSYFVIKKIGFAEYNPSKCIPQSIKTQLHCMSESELESISRLCSRKSGCLFDLTEFVISNTCKDHFKQATIYYHCEEAESILICQESIGDIDCYNKMIKIKEAFFGRKSQDVCRAHESLPKYDKYYQNTHCEGVDSKTILEHLCNGKNKCRIPSTSAVFGEPCPKTFKYADIKYSCIDDESLPDPEDELAPLQKANLVIHSKYEQMTGRVFMCSFTNSSVKCPEDFTLNITSAEIVDDARTLCPNLGYLYVGKSKPPYACLMQEDVPSIFQYCKESNRCQIDLSDYVLGSTCSAIGPIQYLQITHICRGPAAVLICQYSSSDITCPENQVIMITKAFYGRSDSETCRPQGIILPDKYFKNTMCQVHEATIIVQKLCNNQTSCTLQATKESFGEVCPETFKYLHVRYLCKDDSSTKNVHKEEPPENLIKAISENMGNIVLEGEQEKEHQNSAICPFQNSTITCPEFLRIKVGTAIVTEDATTPCTPINPPSKGGLYCTTASRILETLKQCDGKSACQINIAFGFGEPCKINNYIKLFYTCEGPQVVIICQSSHTQITCSQNEIIQLYSVEYGRRSSSTCKPKNSDIKNDRFYRNTHCRSMKAFSKVQELCSGKQSCDVSADINTFGDPCPDTLKYLEIKYFCTDVGSIRGNTHTLRHEANRIEKKVILTQGLSNKDPATIIICQYATGQFSCPTTHKIQIVSSFYGRSSQDICKPHGEMENHSFYQNVECISQNAESFIKTTCNGKTKCSLTASEEMFEDPCIATLKYLEVKFICKESPLETSALQHHNVIIKKSPEILNNKIHICPGSSSMLACLHDHKIGNISIDFNQPEFSLCTQIIDTHNGTKSICHTLEDVVKIVEKCHNKVVCLLNFHHTMFGDDHSCTNDGVIANFDYTCHGPSGLIICENSESDLQCPHNEVLSIHSAFFGRKNSNLCRDLSDTDADDAKYKNTKCKDKSTLRKIRQLCENKESCHLKAVKDIFGDPCADTVKYLEVDYYCHNKLLIK